MGQPLQQSSPSTCGEEQSEPLDLRANYDCTRNDSFCKKKYWLHPTEPLDLRFSQNNLENKKNLPTLKQNQQNLLTVLQKEKVPSYENGNRAKTGYNYKLSACQFPLFRPADEKSKTNYCIDTYKEEIYDSHKLVLSSCSECVNQTLKSPTAKSFDDISNGTPSKNLKEKIKSHLHLTDNNLLDKTNNKLLPKTNRILEKKVGDKLCGYTRNISQDVNEVENKDENNENECLKIGDDAKSFHSSQSFLEKDEDPCPKKLKLGSSAPTINQVTKPSVRQLKKTHESFVQDGKCFEVAPKLPRCRDCSLALQDPLDKTQLGSSNVMCRFYAFRKLRYSSKGFLATAGFLDPHLDPTQEDLTLWQPVSGAPLPVLDKQMARYLLKHVGNQFCNLCEQEEEAVSIHMSEDKKVAWKRLVPGYREMCDVCNTSLFNFHWTCRTCGFAVCIDCYKERKGSSSEVKGFERPWLICVTKRAHDQEKMMMTQIIAADSLKHLKRKAHEISTSLGLPIECCGLLSHCQSEPPQADHCPCKKIKNTFEMNKKETCSEEDLEDRNTDTMGLQLISSSKEQSILFDDYFSDSEKYLARFFGSLRTKLNNQLFEKQTSCHIPSKVYPTENDTTHEDMLEEVILTVFNDDATYNTDLRNNASPLPAPLERGVIPTRVLTLTESCRLYPNCPHSWLCEGRMLKLSDPSHAGNYTIFQDQWKQGQPVLVSGVLNLLEKDLWQPESFIRDFGDTKNDLVNCMTGQVIPGQYMRKFWEGFLETSKMLKDEKGKPMLLKLKDWPPGDDFAEMLPSRFKDLMQALPMGEYTKRVGQLNLPSRLPDSFAKPDLGPKMYIAYGSTVHPTKGTTNLHLDISDAVNVMVYVGIPKDVDYDEFIREALKAIDEACFEVVMRRRVREPSQVPGALWHIYSARDADKIRHLLIRVAKEQKIKLGPHQDPIHDQNWYLDSALRERLYKEYNVRGYTIVQCLGDSVFIPAGAPHQVRNLLNCIKVAEDFVSPENVPHCLHLTQEFRKLSDFHSNHEDKLQIKNIIYHAVKDSVSVLSQ